MTQRLSIPSPPHFDFWRTIYSHGWSSLLPFRIDKEALTVFRVLRLMDGKLVECALKPIGKTVHIDTLASAKLSSPHRSDIKRQIATCLRMEEDLGAFYKEVRRYPRYRWIVRHGAGRMLRAPTVYEDIIKMMCTTNCTWSLTTIVVHNLIGELGEKLPDGARAFPTPEALAGVSESFVRKRIKAGYRSPYLVEFSNRVAARKLDVESWRQSSAETGELFDQVLAIKGIGPYAAGNLLRLLGRYDYLALDSWVRAQYATIHHGGRTVKDRTIEKAYSRFGIWRGLFFWLEMTRSWFDKKFPEW